MSVTTLTVGDLLPWLTLPTAAGDHLRLSTYRGRANLAVYYYPCDGPSTRESVAAIAARLPDYRARHAQPLAILAGSPDRARLVDLTLPYPLLVDPEGRAAARLVGPADGAAPLLALTDRYGELCHLARGWPAVAPANQADVLEWLTYLDCRCSV